MLLDTTQVYSPSSSGYTRLMESFAFLPSNSVVKSLLCDNIRPSFSQNMFGSGMPSTWHSSVIESPSQQRKSFNCLVTIGRVSTLLRRNRGEKRIKMGTLMRMYFALITHEWLHLFPCYLFSPNLFQWKKINENQYRFYIFSILDALLTSLIWFVLSKCWLI